MRRFLHFLTALTLSFSLINAVFCNLYTFAFASSSSYAGDMQASAANSTVGEDALNYLKVLNAADFGADALKTEMPRQEFAKMACIIGGYYPDFSTNIFSDVASDSEYAPYINSLAKSGIISSEGLFEPIRTIELDEALTMLVRILGYSHWADSKGGYPTGYIYVANSLDLSENINNNSVVTHSVAAQLCVNALNTEVMRQVSYGDMPRYDVEDGYTLGYQTFRIIHLVDVVDAVDLSALKGENDLAPYHISIGGLVADIGDLDPWEFLGYEVDAYLYEKEPEREYILKWISKTDNNYETVISVEDIISVDSGVIKYYDLDNIRKCKYDLMSPVIYNGVSTAEPFTMSMIENLWGSVKIVENMSDYTKDVIFVDVYTDYVVSDVNFIDMKVYDKYSKLKQLTIDTICDDPYTIIYNKLGEETELNGVSKDTVLSVYKSKDDADQKYIEIYMSKEKVAGKIEYITSRGGALIVGVGKNEYSLTKNCRTFCESKLKAGITVELLLNNEGYVAGINFDGTGMMFGYLKTAYQDEMSKMQPQLRIFTENGEFENFSLKEKVKIDGISYDFDDELIFTILEAASNAIYPNHRTDLEEHCYVQPIRYSLNSDGRINYIDTIFKSHSPNIKATSDDAEGNNALYSWYTMTTDEREKDNGLRFRSGVNSFGGRFLIDDSTKFLAYPSPEDMDVEYTDENKYTAVNKSYFVGTVYYLVQSYSCTNNNLKSDYLLVETSQGSVISTEEYLAVVKKVTKASHGDEIVTKIKLTGKNGDEEVLCKEGFTFRKVANSISQNPDSEKAAELPLQMTAEDLQTGDVIRYVLTPNGFADNIELYYRIKDGFIVNHTSYASSDLRYIAANGFQIRYGYAVKKYDNAFSMMRTEGFSDPDVWFNLDNASDSQLELIPKYNACTYIIYDSKVREDDDRVKIGSYDDINGYKNVGADCSKVIIQSASCTPSVVVIIK